MKLTDKQNGFCDEYLANGMNATQAYMTIYKVKNEETARTNASRMLTNANVCEYLSERQSEINRAVGVRQEDLAAELKKVAFTEITDFVSIEDQIYRTYDPVTDEEEEKSQRIVIVKETSEIDKGKIGAISGIKQGKYGIELILHDKLRAIEMLGRHTGLFEKDNKQKKPDTLDPSIMSAIAAKLNK